MSEQVEQKDVCPHCGKKEGVPLLWGKQRGDAAEKVAQNQLICAGCDIWSALDEGGLANRECLSCGERWVEREDLSSGRMNTAASE